LQNHAGFEVARGGIAVISPALTLRPLERIIARKLFTSSTIAKIET
jgi:hypothetical protein